MPFGLAELLVVLLQGLALGRGLPMGSVGAVARAYAAGLVPAPSFDDRIEQVSRRLLGKPFRLSPLGEGAGSKPDPDPIFDLEHFDCVTFVEHAIALGWFDDLGLASQALQELRYANGTIRYGARNHLMMAQWIPHNVAAQLVSDITREVAQDRVASATLDLDPGDFQSPEGRKLALALADQPLGRFALPVVPLASMPELLARIPHATILTTVRTERARVPYRESHVGLVVVVGGERRLRHASQLARKVIDEPLAAYVEHCRQQRSWPVTGFNLLAIAKEPPLWLRRKLGLAAAP